MSKGTLAVVSALAILMPAFANGQMAAEQKSPYKAPRVDVTHPDFASGCASGADPTGKNDSACAIQAAITYAKTQELSGMPPNLYLPHGYYKLGSALRIPCWMHVYGDGPASTVIEETNNTEGVTIDGTVPNPIPDSWLCVGSINDIALGAPSGHTHVATQLQLLNAVGYTMRNIRVYGGGGIGIALLGNTERVKAWQLLIDNVRWPLLWQGNENHLWGLNIDSPGTSLDRNSWGQPYCFGTGNCVNGYYPFPWWNGGKLESANANGKSATFYIHGSSGSPVNNNAPIVVGHYFSVSGTSGTVLDGTYRATAITNGVTSDPSGQCTSRNVCFRVQGASTQSGNATVSGAKWTPAILPDRNAAVSVSGANWEIEGGSIKALWYSGGFEIHSTFGSRLANFYLEGYPIQGQPHLDSGIAAGGLPTQSTLTAAMNSSGMTASIANGQWFHSFINDLSDLKVIGKGGQQVKILPQDYAHGSNSASAYVPGVKKGQYEIAIGAVSTDGAFHFTSRDDPGSTAPSGTAWPNGSIIAETPGGSFYGALDISSNHLSGIDPPGSNWSADCEDNTVNVCSEIILGTIPNGVTSFTTGTAAGNAGPTGINLTLDSDEFWTGGTEAVGEGYIKARGLGGTATTLGRPNLAGIGHGGVNGDFGVTFTNVEEADGSYPWSSFVQPDASFFYAQTLGLFTKMLGSYHDSIAGTNPGTAPSNQFAFGREYANSWCDYDTPTASGTHSANRVCFMGGPLNAGGFEYDTWDGRSWVEQFGVNNTGNITDTGMMINGQSLVSDTHEGSSALVNGTVTVSTSSTPSNAYSIAIWNCGPAGSVGVPSIGKITTGKSFVINSSLSADKSTVCWWIH